jgi:hypothetical protein
MHMKSNEAPLRGLGHGEPRQVAGAVPWDATTTMVAEAYEGDVAFQMWRPSWRSPATPRQPPVNRDPAVDQWLDAADGPVAETMRHARLADPDQLEAVIRALMPLLGSVLLLARKTAQLRLA